MLIRSIVLLLALLSTDAQTSDSSAESSRSEVNMADVLGSWETKSGMFNSQKYFSLIEMPVEYSQHGLCKQVVIPIHIFMKHYLCNVLSVI